MSAKVYLKPSEGKYKWSQTTEAITVTLPVKNVLLKNIEILYTDLCLKVNVTSMNYIQVIDFPHEIDFANPGNKVQLTDSALEVFLIKNVPQTWPELQYSALNNKELTVRRQESIDRYWKYIEQKKKETQSKVYELDGEVVKQQMKVEAHQRDAIETAKNTQKNEYLSEMNRDLAKLEERNTQLQMQKAKADNADELERYRQSKQNKNMFEDEEIEEIYTPAVIESSRKEQLQSKVVEPEEEPKVELPQPRQAAKKDLSFTEKTFAHLPARESQLREAPYPKSKNIDKKKSDVYIEIEDKDPVWLKDKGDHFFKRNDFMGAVNAYSKALAADPEFLTGRLNRATTFIRMRAFEQAVEDCNDIIAQILKLKDAEFELDKDFYTKILARTYVKRAAGYSWCSKFNQAIEDFDKVLNNPEYCAIVGDKDIASLHKDKARVQIRMKSNKIKNEGDKAFYHERLEEAVEKYNEALEVDQENEYALANICAIHLKKLEYEQAIELSNRALNVVNSFQNDTKSFAKQNVLEVKLLLRRAKSFEMTQDWEQAKQDLDRILAIEPANGEAKSALKTVMTKLDELMFNKYREEANELLKQKKFQQALDMYEKCLKVTKKATTLDNIAIYVNKIACLLSMDRLAVVVTECNEAIRLIKNFKNRFEVKGADLERLKQMDLRVAIRRGNALGKLGRTSEAIQEYERALKIEPGSAAIEKDLELLRKLK